MALKPIPQPLNWSPSVRNCKNDHWLSARSQLKQGFYAIALVLPVQLCHAQQAWSTQLVSVPWNTVARAGVMADFNQDGVMDLAVTRLGGRAGILLGGSEVPEHVDKDFPVGAGSRALVTADVNEDQLLDIVVANYDDQSISVAIGDGRGGAAEVRKIPVRSHPSSVTIADMNDDGHLDLIATHSTDASISILTGNGHGDFAWTRTLKVGAEPVAIATVDLDGDRDIDIATANRGDSTVTVMIGNGNGDHFEATNYPVGRGPVALAVGDFNGDHRFDLVTANEQDHSVSVLLSAFRGKQTGATLLRYQSAGNLHVDGNPTQIVVGDWNFDSHNDLATGNADTNEICFFDGRGDGRFAVSSKVQVRDFPVALQPVQLSDPGLSGLMVLHGNRLSFELLTPEANL